MGGQPRLWGVQDLPAAVVRFDEARQSEADPEQGRPAVCVSFPQCGEGIPEVGSDFGWRFLLAAAGELAVDPVHGQIEQLDGDAPARRCRRRW